MTSVADIGEVRSLAVPLAVRRRRRRRVRRRQLPRRRPRARSTRSSACITIAGLAVLVVTTCVGLVARRSGPAPGARADGDGRADHRVRPLGAHPGRGPRRAGRARRSRSTTWSTGSSRASRPAPLPRRRRPRAAHADHDRPRPPRGARRRSGRAGRDGRDRHRRARPDEPLRQRPAAAGQGRAARLPRHRAGRPRRAGARPAPAGARRSGRARWVLDAAPPAGVVADRRRPRAARRRRWSTSPPTPCSTPTTAPRSASASPPAADAARLWVRDTGPGVDPAIADTLFDRYARAATSRARRPDGTGHRAVDRRRHRPRPRRLGVGREPPRARRHVHRHHPARRAVGAAVRARRDAAIRAPRTRRHR